jgi:acid stress-induced BolA-like protein IbaG/YrbA
MTDQQADPEALAPNAEEGCEWCAEIAHVVSAGADGRQYLCRAHYREFTMTREIQRQRDVYAAMKAKQ